ncbi:MAG: DNA-processing protein DprA [Bacteroidota bacterium]
MDENTLYLLALSLVKGLGPVHIKNLIAYSGSPQAVFSAPKGKLLKIPTIGEHFIDLVQGADTLKEAEQIYHTCCKADISLIPYTSPDYPHSLKFIHQAPIILYKKGKFDLNSQPAIAIVGTRKATNGGLDIAEDFASFFAKQHINVISGLAYGIDIMAHKAALQAQGVTTAVLGHGLDRVYPWVHAAKAREIIQSGALLSEYPPGIGPDPAHFPARNRIVAGMAKAIIVIEAGERGGALITARMAFDQNREVYAVPGRIKDPRSVGCNNLIRDQIAKLVTHPQEVLDDLEIQWSPENASPPLQLELPLPEHLSSEESKVLNILNQGETQVDRLTKQTGIPLKNLHPLLLTMEFKGLIVQSPGKKFRRR